MTLLTPLAPSTPPAATAHLALNGITALPHLGIIRAQGADVATFLQGQLTQDVTLLGMSEARLAAWCSAKGRMLASFVVFKLAKDDLLLICSADVLPATLKRLQMFVLRAQCKMHDATANFALHGVLGDAIDLIAAHARKDWAKGQSLVRKSAENGEDITVLLPHAQVSGQPLARALHIAPRAAVAQLAEQATPLPTISATTSPTTAHAASPAKSIAADTTQSAAPAGLSGGDAIPAVTLAQWQWAEVMSGIAPITLPIVDALVPQMLNYESVGGVNFKKGCYPGQEVVARSQFRGTLKRRAYIVHSDAALQAGQEVFSSADPSQPCGLVASAAATPSGGWHAVASLQVAAAHAGGLTAGGAPLNLLPLPYALALDI